MGHYLIEEQILFSPEEQQLTHVEKQESINISVIASQILAKLIEDQGHVVERETFFSEIIDRFGAASTNNNLNQYISNIRKQIHYLGIENEIIQTVPRVGFMIPLSIKVIEQHANSHVILSPHTNKNTNLKVSLQRLWAIAMIIIIFSSITRFWKEKTNVIAWNEYPQVVATPINNDKSCQFFILQSGISYRKDDDFDSVSKLVKIEDLTCDKGVNTRYYIYQSPINNSRYRRFVLKCTGDLSRPACYSHYKSVEPT